MPKLNAILCEFFGTLLLVVSVSCAALANTAAGGNALFGEALLNGLPVAIIVTFTLSTSGGQINPAVTIGLLFIGKIKKTEAVVFVMVQVAGAASAGCLIKQILPAELARQCLYGTPRLSESVSKAQGIGIEGFATSLLCLSICATVLHPVKPHKNGFGIGAAVAALVFIFAPMTGAAMNPARQLGCAFAAEHWENHWVYWIGPVLGAVVGLRLFSWILQRNLSVPEHFPEDAPKPPDHR